MSARVGPVFWCGIVIGTLLIVLGGTSMSLGLTNFVVEVFVVCTGLGILLGAFGSTATTHPSSQGIVLTGVAAISAAVFTLIFNRINSQFMLLKIDGDVINSKLDLVGDRSHLGAYQRDSRSFNFVIFGSELQTQFFKLYIEHDDESELGFECIPTNLIRPFLASGRTTEWTYNRKAGRITSSSGQSVKHGKCDSTIEVAAKQWPPIQFSFFRQAHAQPVNVQDGIPEAQVPTDQLVSLLESNVSYARRDARSMLAKKGPEVIPVLTELIEDPHSSYRKRLGALVAISDMATRPENREALSTQLGSAGLEAIVRSATDSDRTIRLHSTELLVRLADPHVVPLAVSHMPSASPNGRFNLALVVGATANATGRLDQAALTQLIELKSENSHKTNAIIDDIVKTHASKESN